jgi:RND superfamily putative drug exporter
MLGLGVGVDYALLIVTRFRSALTAGRRLEEALEEAMVTAGRSVTFAGCAVLVCLLGLLAIGGTLGPALTIACAAGVLGVLLATLTLLPALLALAGPRIERLSRRRPGRRASVERAAWARRWSDVVQRHAWTAFGAGLLVVAVLAIPSLQMRLGVSDAGNLPTSDTTRKAYDAVERGFGPGANGPLVFVARTTSGPAGLLPLQRAAALIQRLPGVVGVTPPQAVGRVGDRPVVIFTATPATGPQDQRTGVLLDRARRLLARSRPPVRVTGATAGGIDYGRVIERVLPAAIAGVLAAAFLLMCLALRSIVVPLKAVIANLLSIGAAYGVVVAVFQWGWGASLLGVGRPGPIDPWVPVLLFATAIGLAMDYEVFLVTRIKEEFLRCGDPHAAVGEGLAATTRVITSAAAIMVCVFVAFVFVSERSVRMLGLGLAAAVLIDATVVRLLLVPATMQILGLRNWWWPAWLGGTKASRRTSPSTVVGASPAESGSVAR